jgi:hypothetical protein
MGLLEKNFEFIHKHEFKKSKKVQCHKILNYLKENNYKFKKYPEDVDVHDFEYYDDDMND